MAPIGTCQGDVTEEGVFDLLGNVSEWTSEDEGASRAGLTGLRQVVGANWSFPRDSPPTKIDFLNARPPTTVDFAMGVRCASE